MLLELHFHTNNSPCSNLTLNKAIKYLKKFGYEGVFITDHDKITLKKEKEIEGIIFFPGVEITTKERFHVLGLHITELPKEKDLESVLEFVKESGGISILAHPFGKTHDLFLPSPEKYLNILKKYNVKIEVFNARCLDVENHRALNFAKKYSFEFSYGGDVHFNFEIGNCIVDANPEKLDKIIPVKLSNERFLSLIKGHIYSNILHLLNHFK